MKENTQKSASNRCCIEFTMEAFFPKWILSYVIMAILLFGHFFDGFQPFSHIFSPAISPHLPHFSK